jgi:short-subunit dehydrogenase
MQSITNKHISVLINNAGFGANGDFEAIESDRQLNMIDLNCRSLTYLLQTVGQQMLKHQIHGYILNVASTAAFQPGPTMATYFATKAFVLSLTHAVRFERKDKHIHVAALCPGATKTDFFNNSHNNPKSMMLQTMMESADVVKIGLE